MTRNEKKEGRVPKLFPALQRPAISSLSKCVLNEKTRANIAFSKGMGVIQGLSRRSYVIVLIFPKHICFGVLM